MLYTTETERKAIGGATGRRLRMRIGRNFLYLWWRSCEETTKTNIPLVIISRKVKALDRTKRRPKSNPRRMWIAGRPCADGRCVEIDGVDLCAVCPLVLQGTTVGDLSSYIRTQWKVSEFKSFPTYTAHKSSTIHHTVLCVTWMHCESFDKAVRHLEQRRWN